eukprot:7099641-Pyramimonas_sp.AAC.2
MAAALQAEEQQAAVSRSGRPVSTPSSSSRAGVGHAGGPGARDAGKRKRKVGMSRLGSGTAKRAGAGSSKNASGGTQGTLAAMFGRQK